MTQFYTHITFSHSTFQRDIIDKLLVNGLHRGDLHDSLILWLYLNSSLERYCDTPQIVVSSDYVLFYHAFGIWYTVWYMNHVINRDGQSH